MEEAMEEAPMGLVLEVEVMTVQLLEEVMAPAPEEKATAEKLLLEEVAVETLAEEVMELASVEEVMVEP